MLEIKISGVSYPVLVDSFVQDESLGERSTIQFDVKDTTGAHFTKGNIVEVFENDTLVFSGYVDSKPTEKRLVPGVMIHSITAVDGHYLADKRIIAKAYENEYAGDIILDIITEKLADEGVTTGLEPNEQTWNLYTGYTWTQLNTQGGN